MLNSRADVNSLPVKMVSDSETVYSQINMDKFELSAPDEKLIFGILKYRSDEPGNIPDAHVGTISVHDKNIPVDKSFIKTGTKAIDAA